jgi:ABC-type Fe3+-siderophore transport system permease subunit
VPSLIFGIIAIIAKFELNWLNARVFAIIHDEFMGKKRLFSFIDVNITNTIIGVLFITGALLVGFSREKREDEYIAGIRLSSLLWAVAVNYLLLLLAFIFIYGTPFLDVMLYNMFTVLILFIARFHYMLYKNSKPLTDEK